MNMKEKVIEGFNHDLDVEFVSFDSVKNLYTYKGFTRTGEVLTRTIRFDEDDDLMYVNDKIGE